MPGLVPSFRSVQLSQLFPVALHAYSQRVPVASHVPMQDAASFRSVLRQVAQDQGQQGTLDEQAAAGKWCAIQASHRGLRWMAKQGGRAR